jgi:hypothetical protein
MLTIGTLAKVAAQIYGCNLEDLLSYCEHADGSVVIIAPSGQKFTYSADEIMIKVLESTQPAPEVATSRDDIAFDGVAKLEGLEPVRQGDAGQEEEDDSAPDLASIPETSAADSVTEARAVAEKATVAKKKTRNAGQKKSTAPKSEGGDQMQVDKDLPS